MADHLIEERKKKLEALRELTNPYPHLFEPEHKAAQLLTKEVAPGEETSTQVKVAGRIMLLRRMGKASFFHIEDGTAKIQCFISKEQVGEEQYDLFKKLELGDFVGIEGIIFATKTGELTIKTKELTVLCKAIRSIPDKYHGVKDTQIRYRKRYLDLMTNHDVRDVFRKRSIIIRTIRRYLEDKDFLEVETPTLQPIYGGASARPFVTQHNALNMSLYMRISPELYLKRLLVGGFERVFEICKNFRNEGVDASHNPEFTMLEWYMAYGDYNTGMQMFEEAVALACKEVNNGSTKVRFKEHELDFNPPWRRATMAELIKEHNDIDVLTMSKEELQSFCQEKKIDCEGANSWGLLVQAVFEETCEEKIIQPTFVIDHPIETTPLCKPLRSGDARLVERFEPFCCGMEIGNAYTELNDPILQRKLLEDQQAILSSGDDDEAHPMDEDFLEAIDHGIPPTSGVGMGLDRITMLLTDSHSIRDVILFPTMKPEEEKNITSEKKDNE